MRFFVNTKRLEPCVEVLEARPPATHRWPSHRLSCARRRSGTETLVLSRAAPVHRVFVGVVEWVEWVISRPLKGSSAHTSAIAEGYGVTRGLSGFIESLRPMGDSIQTVFAHRYGQARLRHWGPRMRCASLIIIPYIVL